MEVEHLGKKLKIRVENLINDKILIVEGKSGEMAFKLSDITKVLLGEKVDPLCGIGTVKDAEVALRLYKIYKLKIELPKASKRSFMRFRNREYVTMKPKHKHVTKWL